MADRRPLNYDNNTYDERDPYASQDATDRAGYGLRDAYETRDQGYNASRPSYTRQTYSGAYDQDGQAKREASPYGGQQPQGRYGQGAGAGVPLQSGCYGSDPYGGNTSRSARGSRGGQQPTQYPVGSGQAYTSSRRPNNASGVEPVTSSSHHRQGGYGPSGNLTPQHNGSGISRRKLLGMAAGGAAAVALLGVGGALWYTHRAVACTIDGKVRELPIGLSVQDIVSRGYASPVAGNLVSICADGEIPDVLERGAGNPYTLCVNGEPVDVSTYKLREGDVLEFINGTDKTEDVTKQTTEIPCGIQVPDSSLLLASIGYVKQWGQNGISTVETGVVSGRTIDRGVTQEARDFIIANSGVNPDDGRRLVAITFDDGPNLDYTPQYLDILARYGAKATFFMLGSTLAAGEEYTQMAQRVRDAGHQIASHTYSHDDCTLSGMDAATREGEISQTFDLIEQTTGVQTSVLRPPYGELRGWQFLQYMADTGRDITMSVYWSVDSEDWSIASNGSGIEDGAAQIVANCTNGLSGDNYNGAIILMHDAGGNRDRDVVTLPSIIERFQAEGYEFVTVNELVAADSTIPEWLSSGNATRPEGSIIPDTSGIY